MRRDTGLSSTVFSSLSLGFALLGDTWLYAILPTHFKALFVPEFWVGFLLSVNRFIRVFANPWVVPLFHRFGFRKLTLFAAGTSVFSTLLYGWSGHLLIWILARLLWAFSFAILRLSALSYSLEARQKGLNLGLSRGLQETGPLIALILGPFLWIWGNAQSTFLWLGVLSAFSLFFAFRLKALPPTVAGARLSFSFIPSPFNFLVFLSSFFIEGVLVVLLGKLLHSVTLNAVEVLALISFYLAFRRVAMIVISPISGLLSDRVGYKRVFVTSIFISILSLALIGSDLISFGLTGCFLSNSITAALAPGNLTGDSKNRLRELAVNVTWRDLGAALGALAGGLLLGLDWLQLVFLMATFVLALALLFYHRSINHPVLKYGSN